MGVKTWLLVIGMMVPASSALWAQCNTLSTNRSIDFKTDQDCAPVTVTQFELTYNFIVPQDPASIEIVYQWNDPSNKIEIVSIANGLIVDPTEKSFTADRTMVYNSNNNQCAIQPTAYIRINGVICPSSVQSQTAFFWENDNEGNGIVELSPQRWDVCFDNPVVDARFRDASEFNCNIFVEQDNPNQHDRHVQFVYGTNHNVASTIRDLTLSNSGTVALTDAAGALVNPETRGADMAVTAGYFGPVETVPFPADAPISESFPMSAPANVANLVGNRFEVTLFNWNTCNPWNGSVANPNYGDAVITRGYIQIVEAPAPGFVTRDAGGNLKSDFCIDEVISFSNTTPNVASYSYTWEFYDDASGTNLISTSTLRNPSYSFGAGGLKLIRLIASSPTAQGSCIEEYERTVNVTPSLAARIGVSDFADNPITPDFCQEFTGSLNDFEVRFTDISSGTVTPTTVWRWEFYDPADNLILEFPAGGAFSPAAPPPFDRLFTTPGLYRVKLRIRDNLTDCESSDEVQVRVFEKPQPLFSASRVCETSATMITDESTVDPIAGEQIVSWEWDINYDGTTFDKDPAFDNQRTVEYTYPSPGTYQVALRVTTNAGSCSSILGQTVHVDPLPLASFTPSITSGCSLLPVEFTNHAVNGQPDLIREFIWEIDEGSGFVTDSIQKPGDLGFSDIFVRNFSNTGTVNRDYKIRLRVITVNNCDLTSAPTTITVFPEPRSGFASLNYSPFNDNCSPVSVNFRVDQETQSLNPTDYTWKINDANGLVEEISTGTTPDFAYNFINPSQVVKDYFVTLRATLPSTCYGDSSRTIRISPVPSSDFAVDTVTYACDRVLLQLDASQKGLSEYSWNISINNVHVFGSTTDGEVLEYEILRSTHTDQNVSLSLTTTNLANCESTATTRQVLVARAVDMNASFNASPAEQTLPSSTVAIQNTSSAGPWEYHWDFGDGATSTNAFVSSHTYETFGNYTITLTLSNNDCVQSVSRDVRVNPIPPQLDFDYFPPGGCAPHTVTFVNQSRYADPTTYFWKFGHGEGTSRAVDPIYTYQEAGLYSVTLSATNELGDTVTLTKELIIDVKDNPAAHFAVYPTTPLNIPGEVLYTDNRSLNATEYLWDFGDGFTSTDPEPQHKYTEEGTFTISLIARNGNGCADTTVMVSGVRTINHGQLLIPNAFIPNQTGPGSGNAQNNEVFLPLVQKVTKFQMLVFNRWGELMFESTNVDSGWDGYYKGRLCAQDVYVYRITVEYENGRTITRTGDINLLR